MGVNANACREVNMLTFMEDGDAQNERHRCYRNVDITNVCESAEDGDTLTFDLKISMWKCMLMLMKSYTIHQISINISTSKSYARK